jgi:hypothetical protein
MDNSIEARTCLIRSGSPGESRTLPALQGTDVWIFPAPAEPAAQAEELAQETFVAVLREAVRYQPQALFRTYICHRAQNLASAPEKMAFRATFSGQSKGRRIHLAAKKRTQRFRQPQRPEPHIELRRWTV